MRIYIDMDGVIFDYETHFSKWKYYYPNNEYPQSKENFWTTMPILPKAIESVKKLMLHHDVHFLTSPSYMNPACYSGKRKVIENYFGIESCKKLIIAYDKSLFKGDILIDDNYDTNEQNNFEGELILFKDWDDAMERLGL